MSASAVERLGAPDDRLGLFATVAIVVGGIVGTGIFTVPAAIADYGWLSVPAFAVVGGGSLALALTFARLVRRTRRSGGPYTEALTRVADTDRDAAFQRFHDALAEHFGPEEMLEIVAVVVNMNVWTRIKLAEGAMPGPAD